MNPACVTGELRHIELQQGPSKKYVAMSRDIFVTLVGEVDLYYWHPVDGGGQERF